MADSISSSVSEFVWGAGIRDNRRGQIRCAATQALGARAAECWSRGGINLFWTCFNFHEIHLTMAQRAAENVQWSNRKPGLFILLLLLHLFLYDELFISISLAIRYCFSKVYSAIFCSPGSELILLQILSRVWWEDEGSEAPTQAELTLTDTGLQRIGAAKFRKI